MSDLHPRFTRRAMWLRGFIAALCEMHRLTRDDHATQRVAREAGNLTIAQAREAGALSPISCSSSAPACRSERPCDLQARSTHVALSPLRIRDPMDAHAPRRSDRGARATVPGGPGGLVSAARRGPGNHGRDADVLRRRGSIAVTFAEHLERNAGSYINARRSYMRERRWTAKDCVIIRLTPNHRTLS